MAFSKITRVVTSDRGCFVHRSVIRPGPCFDFSTGDCPVNFFKISAGLAGPRVFLGPWILMLSFSFTCEHFILYEVLLVLL